MKRKITREIFVEIETVRITKKRSAQEEKKTDAPGTKPKVSSEICKYVSSFSRNGKPPNELINKLF